MDGEVWYETLMTVRYSASYQKTSTVKWFDIHYMKFTGVWQLPHDKMPHNFWFWYEFILFSNFSHCYFTVTHTEEEMVVGRQVLSLELN